MRSNHRAVPAALLVPAALGALLIVLPVVGLVARAPWTRAGDLLRSGVTLDALRISLIVSTASSALAIVLGVPLAWVLARTEFAGRTLLRAAVVLPLVLPPVVGGIALISTFGRRGLLGSWLYRAFGLQLTFTTWAVVLAATFVSFPLVVLAVESGIRALDPRLEDAAAASGASRWYVLRRITVPLLAPSIAAGAALAWARALGEFGATLMFAGNLRGRTQTLPLAVFEISQTDPRGATIVALLLAAICLVVLVLLRRRFLGP